MLLNYFKIALRSISRFKGYTLINLAGLALGLTAGIMIVLYVVDEVSYDRFHSYKDRIYRVDTKFVGGESSPSKESLDSNGWPVGKVLENEFPEVEAVLYAKNASFLMLNHDGKRIQEKSHFVSDEFFELFTFPLVNGNPSSALIEPFTVVISEKMAAKYFPGQDALNAVLTMADTLNMVVTGVMKDIPSNSHIQADILISFSTYTQLDQGFDYNDGWGNINVRNYVLLREGADVAHVEAKAREIYTNHAGDMFKQWGTTAQVVLRPLTNLYLTAPMNGMGPIGSLDRIYLLTGISLFVIILASINFINLTTARSIYRAREVGLRKVVGSTRQGLIGQFLTESFVLTMLAFLAAIALVTAALPLFNLLLSKEYNITSLSSPPVVIGVTCIIVFVTLLSGYYPALVMSGMRPVEVLKGKLQHNNRGNRLRRGLVVFQFAISLTLVMATFVVLQQLDYMQKQQLGFEKEQVIIIDAARTNTTNPNAYQTLKDEMKSLAIVEEVTFANSVPGRPGWQGQVAYPEGRSGDEAVSVEYIAVDEHYVATLGLEMIAGYPFNDNIPSQLDNGLLLNETAVSMFGWASPEDAVGKLITSPSGYPAGEVIGVVKDYHQLGLQQEIGPVVMDYNPGASYLFAIRYKAADTKQLITAMQATWDRVFPGYDFNYFFLEDDFQRQYQAEQRLASVFTVFACITIAIAVIGLLGLVSFVVVARTKEIGVRKVLGADVLNITSLLSREYLLLVILANVIATPIVWHFTNQWLAGFANKMEISPLLFLVTFVSTLIMTALTVGLQTVRAAMADPVKSLRYE